MVKLFIAVALVASAGVAVAQMTNLTSHLLLCEHINLSGRCITFPYITNGSQCINMPSHFNDIVSSAAPEGSSHSCTLYRDYSCTGTTYNITGYAAALTNFNDALSSFRCSS